PEPNRNANDSEEYACIHPISRKDNYWSEDKPSNGRVVWKFSIRTINITEYRNGKDEVSQAKYRTFGGVTDHLIPSIENLRHTFFNPLPPGFGLFGCRKIKKVSSLPPLALMHQKPLSRQGFHLISFEIVREF